MHKILTLILSWFTLYIYIYINLIIIIIYFILWLEIILLKKMFFVKTFVEIYLVFLIAWNFFMWSTFFLNILKINLIGTIFQMSFYLFWLLKIQNRGLHHLRCNFHNWWGQKLLFACLLIYTFKQVFFLGYKGSWNFS